MNIVHQEARTEPIDSCINMKLSLEDRFILKHGIYCEFGHSIMSSHNIVYRSATPDDLDNIMNLWLESLDYHEALDSRLRLDKEAISNVRDFYSNKYFTDDSILEIAMVDGKIIGICGAFIQETPPVHLERKRGFIDITFVSEPHRHLGIGSHLFEKVLDWLKSRELTKVRLSVASRNQIGINFWKKMGFDGMMQIMELEI